MNLEQYIPELMTLVLGAFLGWFPNRKKQRVDTKQIEVDVLEKSLQVLHKDVVEPLTARFVLLQEDYGNVLVQLKQLRNAIEKMHNCRYVNECPIRRELQNDKANGNTHYRRRTPTNRQREPDGRENRDADCDPEDGDENDGELGQSR